MLQLELERDASAERSILYFTCWRSPVPLS